MSSLPRKPRSRGYTLIELMIVVVVATMLMAIAIPGYQGYVERAQNRNAIAAIGEMQLALYRFELTTGAFPATLAEAGLDGRLDPWGNPYEYLNLAGARRGAVRKDRNLVPINTDFDLYSSGPDGASVGPLTAKASRDDIIRASNGAFIGIADDY